MRFNRINHGRRTVILLVAASWLTAGQLARLPSASAAPRPPEEVKLVLHPAAEPRPALKYRLLPSVLERRPGNAAVLYNKICINYGDTQPRDAKQFSEWAKLPPSELPVAEVRKTLADYRQVLADLRLVARYDRCDWQLPLREQDLFTLALPEVASGRSFAWLLAVQARLQMAQGDLDGAFETLQTGFALIDHMAEGPLLMHALVAGALCGIMSDQVQEFIQQPGAPNLYWALTALPRPLVDVRRVAETEASVLFLSYPEFYRLDDHSHSEEYWEQLYRKLVEQVAKWGDWYWKENKPVWQGPEGPALLAIGGYPTAKQGLVEMGWSPEEVHEMPISQVMVLYMIRTYQEIRDQQWKWVYVSHLEVPKRAYWDAVRESETREILPLYRLLTPATQHARIVTAMNDRRIALLRTLEALRTYAAGHDGRLPQSLDEVTKVPIPLDPMTGKPFTYQLRGQGAVLEAPSYEFRPGLRFQITLAP